MKSQPITISRYSNGTLVKLNVTDSAFVSYDYNPETDAATYIPNTITITPTFSGGVKFGKWRYSTNGANFYDVVSGQHGFTTSGNTLILNATSDLYKTTNSAVIVACYGDNPLYYDTVTIMRYVDPTFVYKKTSTAIKQTNDKISLIATEEQLAKYGSKFTVLDDLQAQIDVIPSKISLAVKEEHGIITGEMNTALAEYATLETMESRLDITAKDITSSVARTYQTKADAIEDLDEAKGYTDDVKATLRSEIQQSANSITSTVSATYQTIADAEDDLAESKAYADTAKQNAEDYADGRIESVSAELETKIEQTASGITSTVSATYQTKKAAADDLAESKTYTDNAEKYAKEYADTVANEAKAIANGKVTTYYQTAAPSKANAGDLWIDTDDGNSLHRYDGSNWTSVDNSGIQKALVDAATAQSTADGKIITFAQSSQPTATGVGDLWIDTDDDNKLYRWNGSAWTAYRDGAIAKAESSAKSYADSKTTSLRSEIKQTTDGISTEVSKKVGNDEVISKINQSPESIKISASKLNITGFVTFDNLKNSGETTINGSNITTGSINASLIKGGKLILQPGNTYTTAMEVQDRLGNKLISIDANGMTGYVGGVVPTFKLLENEISFYRYSDVLTQIKNGDIYTAGKMYFTSGSSYAGTRIIEIGQTSSGAVLNVMNGKTTLKATEISASSGKALQITGNSSDYALHVTFGETALQKLTAGETTINNTLTVKNTAGWDSSDAIKVSTGRINAPVYYGALYATSSKLGFFGGGTNATKQYVSKLYLNATLANVIIKVNDLLTALARYNLITSY